MKYAAFLRGINVGGKSMVKMTDLKKLFEDAGLENVVTILGTGNVVFDSQKATPEDITRKIELRLKKKYKRDIIVMIRSMDELLRMERTQPFKGIEIKPNTRLYVTFLYEPSRGVRIPDANPSFKILSIRDMDAFSVLELSDEEDTTDVMGNLAKIFGEKITMRNWNTILKVIRSADVKSA